MKRSILVVAIAISSTGHALTSEQISCLENIVNTSKSVMVKTKDGAYRSRWSPFVLNLQFGLQISRDVIETMAKDDRPALVKIHDDTIEFKTQSRCAETKPECFEARAVPLTDVLFSKAVRPAIYDLKRFATRRSLPNLPQTLEACSQFVEPKAPNSNGSGEPAQGTRG